MRDSLKRAALFPLSMYFTSQIVLATSRGAINAATTRLDPKVTSSWEFSAFSQNGEDGIIWHLLSYVREPNRYFIEIGASDGLENNSSFLALVKKYSGLMIDGDARKIRNAQRFMRQLNWGVEYVHMMVEPETLSQVRAASACSDPDFFSLDVDGNDYHLLKAVFEVGFRPKVICVEYNSSFGPHESLAMEYQPAFDYLRAHPSALYYGVSVSAWRALLSGQGYRFVTVDSNGVNAFFVDPGAVDVGFLDDLSAVSFAENYGRRAPRGSGWQAEYESIREMPLVAVPDKP